LDETRVKIFLNEFLQSLLFRCQKRVYRTNRRLSTLFQIDFEVIRTMRREDSSFSFAENVSKFVILGRDIGEIRSFYKFCRVGLNVQRTKTEFKIVGAQKFNACKNAAASIIVMLDRPELDTEVSDAGMETAESDDCREIFKKDRNANGVLAVT